jgi:diacylglycerol kinase family enzyme
MKSAGLDVSGRKVGAIINTSSGGCGSESEAEILDILKSAGMTNCKTWCGESDQIERAFAEAAMHNPEMLVVLSKTQRVAVQSGRDIPLFVDGERVKVGKKAEIIFVPSAVNVIVPANRTS